MVYKLDSFRAELGSIVHHVLNKKKGSFAGALEAADEDSEVVKGLSTQQRLDDHEAKLRVLKQRKDDLFKIDLNKYDFANPIRDYSFSFSLVLYNMAGDVVEMPLSNRKYPLIPAKTDAIDKQWPRSVSLQVPVKDVRQWCA